LLCISRIPHWRRPTPFDLPSTPKSPLYSLHRPHHDGRHREEYNVHIHTSLRRSRARLRPRLCPRLAASAQLLNHKDLTASIAITIAQTAIETCKANGYAVSATVVGRNGEIIVQVRGDNTGPHTIENSFRKAYTARTFRSPSGALVDRLKADPTLA